MKKEMMHIDLSHKITKMLQKVCKKSSDQFASTLCSYTLQNISADSKI
jgi:hypothetical protein